MPQIKKPDDLRSISNLIRFLCMRDNFPVMLGIAKGVEDRHCGQIPEIDVLPVTGVWLFTGRFQKRHFDRKPVPGID